MSSCAQIGNILECMSSKHENLLPRTCFKAKVRWMLCMFGGESWTKCMPPQVILSQDCKITLPVFLKLISHECTMLTPIVCVLQMRLQVTVCCVLLRVFSSPGVKTLVFGPACFLAKACGWGNGNGYSSIHTRLCSFPKLILSTDTSTPFASNNLHK